MCVCCITTEKTLPSYFFVFLLYTQTWYAAVGQCFFSLSVGFGPIVMFSSYNQFRQNIYRYCNLQVAIIINCLMIDQCQHLFNLIGMQWLLVWWILSLLSWPVSLFSPSWATWHTNRERMSPMLCQLVLVSPLSLTPTLLPNSILYLRYRHINKMKKNNNSIDFFFFSCLLFCSSWWCWLWVSAVPRRWLVVLLPSFVMISQDWNVG